LSIVRFIHFFVFIFWYGTLLYFTFVQAPVLFKTLPLRQFGEVQSRLFPVYYWIAYVCGTLLVATFPFLHPLKNASGREFVRMAALCLMLLVSLGQGFWAGPQASRLRLERQAAEDSGDAAQATLLSKAFGKAHGISSLMNLVVIIAGTVYWFYGFREVDPS